MSARKKDKNSKIIWTSSSRMSGSGSLRGTKEALGGKEGPKVKLPCAEAVSVQQVRKLKKTVRQLYCHFFLKLKSSNYSYYILLD